MLRLVFVLCMGCMAALSSAPIRSTQAQPAHPPIRIPYDVPALEDGSIDFGSLEADSLLDLVVTGRTPAGDRLLSVYRIFLIEGVNHYLEVPTNVTPVVHGAVRWGDYDADGDDDLIVAGYGRYFEDGNFIEGPVLQIFENTGPSAPGLRFQRTANLTGLVRSTAAWGDYDGDGDLDIMASGLMSYDAEDPVTRLYRNDDGTFTAVDTELPGVHSGDAAWADYDGDGDADLALLGDAGGVFLTRLYRNDAGRFVDAGVALPPLAYGSLDWGDYDNDGDLDLLATGGRLDPRFLLGATHVLRNDDGILVDTEADLGGWALGEARWGDADRDGDLDVFVVGSPAALETPFFRLFTFDGSSFSPAWEYGGLRFASMTVADYNGDGDADVAMIGSRSSGTQFHFMLNWDYTECLHSDWVPAGFSLGNCEGGTE